MPDILVRDLDRVLVDRLKESAERHGRSLQKEVKAILAEAVPFSRKQAIEVARYWQKKLAGRKHTDSAELIREDRDR